MSAFQNKSPRIIEATASPGWFPSTSDGAV